MHIHFIIIVIVSVRQSARFFQFSKTEHVEKMKIHCKFSGRDLRYFFIVRGKVSNYDRVPVGHFRRDIGTCYIRKEDLSIEYSQCGHRFCFCDGQIALSFICVTLVRYILFKLGSS